MMRLLHGRWAGIAIAVVAALVVVTGTAPVWVLVVAAVVAVAGVIWAALDAHRARSLGGTYAAFAAAHGWDYVTTTQEYGGRFSTYPFASGVRRRQENLIRGDFNGMSCATFTHVYESETKDASEPSVPIAHQVTMVELPVALPRIDLIPEGTSAQLAKRLGGRDIEVESHEFNRRWRVLAQDERYARQVLDPRLIDRLTAEDANGMAIRIEGGAVYTWAVGRQSPDALGARLGVVTAVARRIPQHVIKEHRSLGYGLKDGFSEHAPAWATEPGALTTRKPTDLAAAAGWMPTASTPAPHGGAHAAADAVVSGRREAPAPESWATAPGWATEPGALTRRRYTGVGVDADGDGIEDWRQMSPGEGPPRR